MRHPQPTPRALVLIDVENLAGTSRPTEADGWSVLQSVQAAFPTLPTDHVVVASHPANVTCASVLRRELGALLKVRAGGDGADLALLEAAELFLEQDAKKCRFSVLHLVICSGDGIFAGLARDFLREHGPYVSVVSRRSSLNWELAQAATDLRILPKRPDLELAA